MTLTGVRPTLYFMLTPMLLATEVVLLFGGTVHTLVPGTLRPSPTS